MRRSLSKPRKGFNSDTKLPWRQRRATRKTLAVERPRGAEHHPPPPRASRRRRARGPRMHHNNRTTRCARGRRKNGMTDLAPLHERKTSARYDARRRASATAAGEARRPSAPRPRQPLLAAASWRPRGEPNIVPPTSRPERSGARRRARARRRTATSVRARRTSGATISAHHCPLRKLQQRQHRDGLGGPTITPHPEGRGPNKSPAYDDAAPRRAAKSSEHRIVPPHEHTTMSSLADDLLALRANPPSEGGDGSASSWGHGRGAPREGDLPAPTATKSEAASC